MAPLALVAAIPEIFTVLLVNEWSWKNALVPAIVKRNDI